MSLPVALILGALSLLISAGVGVYLQRYRGSVTEMLGMMAGMTFGMMA